MRKFKTESQRVLDMMINSIYTHKEIFVRELLSNCSDAIDKLYYKSLSDGETGLNRDDFVIGIELDKEKRTIKITDNGVGMTAEELAGRQNGSRFFRVADSWTDLHAAASVKGELLTTLPRGSIVERMPEPDRDGWILLRAADGTPGRSGFHRD